MSKLSLTLIVLGVFTFAACGESASDDANNENNTNNTNNTNNNNDLGTNNGSDMGSNNGTDMGTDMEPDDMSDDMIDNEAQFVATETILKINKVDDGTELEDIKEIDIKIAAQCTDSPSYRISWDMPRESKFVAEFNVTDNVTLDYENADQHQDKIKIEKLSYIALNNDVYDVVKSGKIIVAATPEFTGVAKDELTLDADITFTLSNTTNPQESDVVFAMDLEYYFDKHPCSVAGTE